METNLFNIEEVAEQLRVSRDTAYRLAASGSLSGTKIGRSWRFSQKSIDRYLQRRTASDDGDDAVERRDDEADYWRVTPDLTLCIDLEEGAVIKANPAARTFFGSEACLIGRRLRSLHVDADAQVVENCLNRLRRGVEIASEEATLISGDGKRVQVDLCAIALGRGDRRTQAFLFYRDVTTLKARECRTQLLIGSEFASAVGAPGDGIVVAAPDGRLVHCNERARQLIAILPEPGGRISCGDYCEFFLPDGRTPFPAEDLPVRRALLGESTELIELVRRMPGDEKSTWLRMRSFPLKDASGEIAGAVCIFQDVTESKREESRLLCTEFSVRRCPDAVYWIDSNGRILYANDAACEALGYESNEFLNMTLFDFALDRDANSLERLFARLRTAEKLQFDGRHRSRQGRVFPVEVSANLVVYEGVEIVCAYARDVSSRRSVERELRESEARFQRAIAGSRDGLWDWDIRSGAVWYSPQYLEQLGLAPGTELAPKLESWRDRIHPDDVGAVDAAVQAHLQGHAPYEIEYRLRTESGEYRWFRVRGQAFWDEHGLPERMSGSMTDVTEQRRRDAASTARKRGMQLLIEKTPSAIAMLDRDLRYVAHSRVWATAYGLSEQSLVGRLHYDVFPALPDRWREVHRECLGGAVRSCVDDEMILPDGTPIRLDWEIHPWYEDDERIGGVIMFTETRRAPTATESSRAGDS